MSRSEWVNLRDANLVGRRQLLEELSELAIEFASEPDQTWTGIEIAEFMRERIARRRKLPAWETVPVDRLPRSHQKMQAWRP